MIGWKLKERIKWEGVNFQLHKITFLFYFIYNKCMNIATNYYYYYFQIFHCGPWALHGSRWVAHLTAAYCSSSLGAGASCCLLLVWVLRLKIHPNDRMLWTIFLWCKQLMWLPDLGHHRSISNVSLLSESGCFFSLALLDSSISSSQNWFLNWICRFCFIKKFDQCSFLLC